MNPRIYVLPILENNADEIGVYWKNTGRKADDWKAKIFEDEKSGLQFAIYDREQTLIRLETKPPSIDGVSLQSKCPSSSAFTKSFPKFEKDKGYCVTVDSYSAFRKLMKAYIGLEIGSPSFKDFEDGLTDLVEKSAADGAIKRKKRLKKAPKIPSKRVVEVTVYDRNPDVIVEVLERAGGICEICGNRAPFKRRKKGTPYLEVHHKIPLASGGEDTVRNAVAACPNCHRREHYG